MRVALAAHSGWQVGGVERYLRTVAPALRGIGHDVACWVERSDATGEPLFRPADDVPCFLAGETPAAALDALSRWKPDVVYSHGVASLPRERELVNVAPAVVFAHSYYGTCISGSKTQRRLVQRCCTKALSAACLLRYHARGCGGLNPLTMVRQFQLQRGRLDLLDAYERILVASQHMADEYARHGLGDKVRLISLPVESTQAGARHVHDAAAWRLLYLGRLEQTKGVDIALESAAIVASSTERSVNLEICGEGSFRSRLHARAAELMQRHPNLKVELTGWLEENEAKRAIARTDLLLMPSCWPEPFGMVGVEAALQGVPTVAFAVGGIPEWLTDGVNGRLVAADPADAGRFAEAIRSCLSMPDELRRLGQQSVNTGARFGLAAHVRQLEDILADVIVMRSQAGRIQ